MWVSCSERTMRTRLQAYLAGYAESASADGHPCSCISPTLYRHCRSRRRVRNVRVAADSRPTPTLLHPHANTPGMGRVYPYYVRPIAIAPPGVRCETRTDTCPRSSLPTPHTMPERVLPSAQGAQLPVVHRAANAPPDLVSTNCNNSRVAGRVPRAATRQTCQRYSTNGSRHAPLRPGAGVYGTGRIVRVGLADASCAARDTVRRALCARPGGFQYAHGSRVECAEGPGGRSFTASHSSPRSR